MRDRLRKVMAHFSFHHLGCLVQLSFTLPDRRDWRSVDLFSATPFFATSGTVDLREESPKIKATNFSSRLTLPLPTVMAIIGMVVTGGG